MQTELFPDTVNTTPLAPRVTVSSLEDLPEAYRHQLLAAGLSHMAPIEAWTVLGSNRQNGYSTHGIFRFFGKFPPPIGRKLISDYSRPGDLILDPMCGSGTTGVEAVLLRRRALQFDVNPLAVEISLTKTTHVPRSAALQALQAVVESYAPATPEEYPVKPVGLRNPNHWFLPETCDSLRGLHRAIEGLPDGPEKRLLRTAYLATIRRCSRATTQQGRLFLDAATALPDALATFMRAAKRAIDAAAAFPPRSTVPTSPHDARHAIPLGQYPQPSLVIVHPPYFNAYKYSRITSLELAWMGVSPAEIRKREVREFFKVGRPENASRYVADLELVLRNVLDVLAPGGIVALMIGDTHLRGELVPVASMLLKRILPSRAVSLELIVLRVPRHTEATWVASQRRDKSKLGANLCDYILILRKQS